MPGPAPTGYKRAVGGRSGRQLPGQGTVVNERELVRVAVFNLEQTARRILTLADEARGADLDRHLRGLSRSITARARDLKDRYAERAARRRP